MALNLANVITSDTFNEWRVKTNQIIAQATSSTATQPQSFAANTTFNANVAITGTLSGSNVTTTGGLGAGGTITAPGVTANTATIAGALNAGSLTVTGDAQFNGNTTIVNQTTIETTDALMHLASNNYFTDTLDIGFFGHYSKNSQNNHVGIVRDAGTKAFYVFSQYVPGSAVTNNIDITHGTFGLANVHLATLHSNTISINSTTIVDTNRNVSNLGTGAFSGKVTAPHFAANTATVGAGGVTTTGAGSFGANVTAVSLTLSSTGAMKIPVGNTGQREDAGIAGSLRYNTEVGALEISDGTSYGSASGGGGGGSDFTYYLATA